MWLAWVMWLTVKALWQAKYKFGLRYGSTWAGIGECESSILWALGKHLGVGRFIKTGISYTNFKLRLLGVNCTNI